MKTFTDVFDFVAFRLMNAGWLGMYSIGSTEYLMEWSRKGAGRVALMRSVIDEFGLTGGPAVLSGFTKDCVRIAASRDHRFRESGRMFWLACLEELSLNLEEDCWWALVRIIEAERGKSTNISLPVGLAILRMEDTIHVHAGVGAPIDC